MEYILNQIVRKLQAFIQKKKKIEVKPTTIKEQLMLFVRCDIDNPSFDSQTKDYMSTAVSNFGSSCIVRTKLSTCTEPASLVVWQCSVPYSWQPLRT